MSINSESSVDEIIDWLEMIFDETHNGASSFTFELLDNAQKFLYFYPNDQHWLFLLAEVHKIMDRIQSYKLPFNILDDFPILARDIQKALKRPELLPDSSHELYFSDVNNDIDSQMFNIMLQCFWLVNHLEYTREIMILVERHKIKLDFEYQQWSESPRPSMSFLTFLEKKYEPTVEEFSVEIADSDAYTKFLERFNEQLGNKASMAMYWILAMKEESIISYSEQIDTMELHRFAKEYFGFTGTYEGFRRAKGKIRETLEHDKSKLKQFQKNIKVYLSTMA